MKTFQEYLKEAGFREGSNGIIFKGKEIDTDTIEYDMQDYSDMIFVIDIGVKYTDGTEVDDEDMDDLQELPGIVDWVSDDYNDRMADQADMYRDAQRHGDFESTNEEMDPEVSDEMGDKINAWIEKYSKYEGGYGKLPEGYVKWALDSGIATDFIEENEDEAMEQKYGDAYINDPWDLKFYNQMPITKACMEELEKITGDTDIDHNARIIDKVMHGDGNESTNEDTKDNLLGDLESGLENAKAGNNMSDFIADEIGDYIRSGIEDMGEEAWQDSIEGQALAELDPVDTPEEQAMGFQKAINILKGGNESTNEDRGRGIGTLDKFRELYRKGIGTDDDEVVLRELIEVINDDALFADEFPELKAFTSASEFDDSEIVTAKDVPGNSADEKIESLIKAIDDDEWVESFVITLMKDFNLGENAELDRIKELAGASIDETYDDDDAFYEAYGEMWYNEDDIVDEAEYQGRKVKLGKPMQGDVKKFKVYVKDPKTGNVKKVNFGHGGSSVKGKAMSIKKSNPKRRKSFRARHNCDNPGPRTKARYWSCRKW
jgi:hypothetical protein